MSLLVVGGVIVLVAVFACCLFWRWITRPPIDQSVSDTWLNVNGRDAGKRGKGDR